MTSSDHPSRRPADRVLARPRSEIELRRRTAPITCVSCQVIYLTPVALPASVRVDSWVCGRCLGVLLNVDLSLAPPPSGTSAPIATHTP
jgi:hypothetical protein